MRSPSISLAVKGINSGARNEMTTTSTSGSAVSDQKKATAHAEMTTARSPCALHISGVIAGRRAFNQMTAAKMLANR